ncbi:hypothetical protein DFQ27_002601 [Actinomortierella ambigua]|uniref:Methyltransferase domain-containing protein n=1 Tax=Actinomortierella ambigua TaxID=1343610 RepID=A0A9P6UD86_9FUNG|nr:hypothetical protein DFQ27_002601 [Actinomortierella ambigua]
MTLRKGTIQLYAWKVVPIVVIFGTIAWLFTIIDNKEMRQQYQRYQQQQQQQYSQHDQSQQTDSNWAPSRLREIMTRYEAIYQKHVQQRDAMLKKMSFGSSSFNPWGYPMVWWWYFQPAFNCPYEVQRVGTLADGGKWVCGLSLYEEKKVDKCVIYSFGVASESTFEEDILARTHCEIYAYDASVDKLANGLDGNPRAHFKKIFVGTKDKVDDNGNEWKTLKTIMKENGHDWIDLLKIDVEGFEYEVLNGIMDAVAGSPGDDNVSKPVLPFSQLQLELHLKDGMPFNEFLDFWRRLESFGLRAFSTEPNLLATTMWKLPLWFSEYSFINTAGRHPLIE